LKPLPKYTVKNVKNGKINTSKLHNYPGYQQPVNYFDENERKKQAKLNANITKGTPLLNFTTKYNAPVLNPTIVHSPAARTNNAATRNTNTPRNANTTTNNEPKGPRRSLRNSRKPNFYHNSKYFLS
jgi:hypothetical protein